MKDLTKYSDLDLINEVKVSNSSNAMVILSNRHSGIYCNIANQFKLNPYVSHSDVIKNKDYIIWKAALKYDKNLGSFANLVGNMARWECYAMITDSQKNRLSQKVDVDEAFGLKDESGKLEYNEIISYVEELLPNDPKTKKIILDRFTSGGSKPTPWREVAKKNGMSHWGCILRAKTAIKDIQDKLKIHYKNNVDETA
jgi:hypothetical protein